MKKCKTILWFQGATATQKDTLLIDGKNVSSVGEREDAFNFIIKGREDGNRILSAVNRETIKVGNRLLKNYKLSQIEHKWYLFTSDFKEKRDQKRKEGINISPSLLCYEDINSNILIRSHFLERDESGRRIVFTFYANTSDVEEACVLLRNLIEPLDKHCNKEDFNFIKDLSEKKKTNKRRFVVILFSLLVILIFSLWRIIDK